MQINSNNAIKTELLRKLVLNIYILIVLELFPLIKATWMPWNAAWELEIGSKTQIRDLIGL